ncbi:MAG: YDG domain-containing protein, partial [Coriobacteriales bacterium]|nr:YDG domain-containing protein [Coriobacteriales bacterium]
MSMFTAFKQSMVSDHYPLNAGRGWESRRPRALALLFLAAVFSLVLIVPSAAYAADPSFTVSHPVTVTVRDATGSGLPGTGDSFLPVALAFVALAVSVAFIAYSLYARNKKRSQALAKARAELKAHRLIMLPFLATALIFGGLLTANPPVAQAAPGDGTHITVEKGKGATARFNVSVDATATQSRYLDIVAALEDSFPGVSFSLDGDSFDSAGDTAIRHVSDPQNQSGGVHTLTLTAQVSKDLKVGSYTHNVKFTVVDKRMPLATGGVTPQDRVYDGTQDVTMSGTPTLTGLTAGDQVSLSNPSYTVDDANAGVDKPVSAHGTLTGPDAFKYLLSGALSPDPDVTITPAPLAFMGGLSVTKAYDGTPDIDPASIQVTSPTSFSGLVGQEGFTLSTAGITSAAFADAAAGANKPVTYTGAFSLSDPKGGALASNYTLTPPTLVGTIDAPPIPDNSIKLEAAITAPWQRVALNKYFANNFTVDWGDGSPVQSVTTNIIHSYTTAGTYTITLTSNLAGNPYAVWSFIGIAAPLVPAYETTA